MLGAVQLELLVIGLVDMFHNLNLIQGRRWSVLGLDTMHWIMGKHS